MRTEVPGWDIYKVVRKPGGNCACLETVANPHRQEMNPMWTQIIIRCVDFCTKPDDNGLMPKKPLSGSLRACRRWYTNIRVHHIATRAGIILSGTSKNKTKKNCRNVSPNISKVGRPTLLDALGDAFNFVSELLHKLLASALSLTLSLTIYWFSGFYHCWTYHLRLHHSVHFPASYNTHSQTHIPKWTHTVCSKFARHDGLEIKT